LIVDLTPVGSEEVPQEQLLQAAARARSAGTTLRIVVAGPEDEFIPAKDVVDKYGGTAISYQAQELAFQGASNDIASGQLDRAIDAAKVEFNIGDSADAFVRVLETEGLEPLGSGITSLLLLILFGLAALFMLAGAWSYMQARKKRARRQREFVERKTMLAEWATQLAPELESLRPAVAASADAGAQTAWHEARDFVERVMPQLEKASNAPDLDLAEMGIAQTAMNLRDLRNTVVS